MQSEGSFVGFEGEKAVSFTGGGWCVQRTIGASAESEDATQQARPAWLAQRPSRAFAAFGSEGVANACQRRPLEVRLPLEAARGC